MAETSTSTQSHACCTVPPVVGDNYKEKGSWTEVNGLKTYSTGDGSSKTGILVVYDIFGFFPQTLQGADIIASGDSKSPYQVFMPDFFDGSPADISWYPPDTDEKGKKLGAFFQNEAAPPKTVNRIPKVLKEIESKHSSIKEWGILGYCWGGKIVNLVSQKDSQFKSAVACHPAMVDANDAEAITIPIAMLPSKDESQEDLEKWSKAIKVKNTVKWWPNQVHGFMAARSDLKDPKVKADYEAAYNFVLNWYHETM